VTSGRSLRNRSEGICEQYTMTQERSGWWVEGRDGSGEAQRWTGHLQKIRIKS